MPYVLQPKYATQGTIICVTAAGYKTVFTILKKQNSSPKLRSY